MYAKRLGAEGLKSKIEELLQTLLGDIFTEEGEKTTMSKATDEGKGWNTQDENICGWDRTTLLKDVVLILGKPTARALPKVCWTRLMWMGY